MPLKKYRPLSPDPYVNKIKGDTEFARLAHLNDLANQVEDALGTAIPSQTGNAGEFLTTDGTNASWAPIASSRIPLSQLGNNSAPSEGVLINQVPNGAITDGVLPRTLNGAMTTAVISKVGNFDKLAVTGGNTSSFVRFDNIFIADNESKIKLTVKIENLNKDGVTGTSNLGLIIYGLSNTYDTGSAWNSGGSIELISRVGTNYGFSGGTGPFTFINSSAGTLVSNGDILDIEYQMNNLTAVNLFRVVNRTTGEYYYGRRTFDPVFFGTGFVRSATAGKIGRLGIMASNADFTILNFEVYSGQSTPLVSIVGDNFAAGYNTDRAFNLSAQLPALIPYQVSTYLGTGAGIYTTSRILVQEALKLKPKYVFFFSGIMIFNGDFRSTDPDYTNYYPAFTNMINQIIARAATPVLVKFPLGGQMNTWMADWWTFVDQQVVAFPQIKVLDMRSLTFFWNDSFGIPGPNDFAQMADAINNFLIAEGY